MTYFDKDKPVPESKYARKNRERAQGKRPEFEFIEKPTRFAPSRTVQNGRLVGTVVYVRIIKEFAFVVANDVRHFLSLRQFAPEDVVRITIGTNIEFTPDKRPTTEHPDATRAVILD